MKDQYFGDINDYRKYGLLRALIHAGQFRLLVAWMLTPDDGSSDGKLISYLKHPGKWSGYDPDLFQTIKSLLDSGRTRSVKLIEKAGVLPNTKYFTPYVPDKASDRLLWFEDLCRNAQGCDFVFLDPDNGLEVKSKPYGRKGSSKYLYWNEVKTLWNSGKSLLIYQHFIRENRQNFIQRMLKALKLATPGSSVGAFLTPHVVFLIALQPNHKKHYKAIVRLLKEKWEDSISSSAHRILSTARHPHSGSQDIRSVLPN
ncbi:MAG: hypothetical protein SCM96_15710 [Acidobacteriota bacterium]|nr:hypothetical protein [Acidobacteriota bacterium]